MFVVVSANTGLLYPFYYHCLFQVLEDGWLAFTPHSEFAKYRNSSEFRITDANRNFQVKFAARHSLIIDNW